MTASGVNGSSPHNPYIRPRCRRRSAWPPTADPEIATPAAGTDAAAAESLRAALRAAITARLPARIEQAEHDTGQPLSVAGRRDACRSRS